MPTVEKISEYISKMPNPYQVEVLHYVEYLWQKLQTQGGDEEDILWQRYSLASALRDMDEADEVTYTIDDLKEKF
jgi:hypothetical protein